jgi:AcrR family transcriptional regulator
MAQTSLREQTRAVVRSLLARTALELFTENGFDNTTIDDVAAAAGVSRRTVFNYFRNKEDLALGSLSEQGDLIAARFAERPTDEDVWDSLREAFRVLDEIDIAAERRIEMVTLLFGDGNDSLRAGHAEKQARWQDLLSPLIEPRLPKSPHRTLEARAIAAAAITCLQAANEEWARLRGKGDVFELYDRAVQAVRG